MTVQLDNFDPEEKRQYVLVGVTIGLFLSTTSTALRIWAKLISTKTLRGEDCFMCAALFGCIGTAICMYYSLTTGLGQHEHDLTELQMKNFLIALWVIQRLQPPTLFCVKTSIIIFYVRIFPTRAMHIAGWGIWAYTFLWMIAVWFATLFECSPVNYFWNKTIEGGHCIANPLITIGLSSGVLSCVGDMFIFAMPIPVVIGLNMNRRKKIALAAIFMVGLFVIVTSFVRWIALLTTKEDLTSNQVEAGVWTYLEISIGITCGNLPLLLPLVRSWFSTGDSSHGYHGDASDPPRSNGYTPRLATPHTRGGGGGGGGARKPTNTCAGFTTLDDSPSGSEVELRSSGRQERGSMLAQPQSVRGDSVGASSHGGLGPEVTSADFSSAAAGPRPDGGIVVERMVNVQYDEPGWSGNNVRDGDRNAFVGGFGVDATAYRSRSRGEDV